MHHARQHAETRTRERRHRLAHEAARLMAEGGIRDYHQAKLKAAERLGIHDDASLPRNREIEEALREYQRLFVGETAASRPCIRVAQAALRALEFLADFSPRLVGPVLEGTADANSPVLLHLHTDDADAVPRFLEEHRIPARCPQPALSAGSQARGRFPGVAVQRGRPDLRPDRAAAGCAAPGAAVRCRRKADETGLAGQPAATDRE